MRELEMMKGLTLMSIWATMGMGMGMRMGVML